MTITLTPEEALEVSIAISNRIEHLEYKLSMNGPDDKITKKIKLLDAVKYCINL